MTDEIVYNIKLTGLEKDRLHMILGWALGKGIIDYITKRKWNDLMDKLTGEIESP